MKIGAKMAQIGISLYVQTVLNNMRKEYKKAVKALKEMQKEHMEL